MSPSDASAPGRQNLIAEIEKLGDQLTAALSSIGKVIFGQSHVVDIGLITLMYGGHALLIGITGV